MTSSLRAAGLSAFRRLPVPVRRLAVRLGTPRFTVGAVLVVRRGEHVLLLRQRHTGGWGLPGGLLQRGEEPVAGVRRELTEEVGVRVPGELPRPTVNVDARARRVDVIYELAGDLAGEPQPQEPEILEVGWFPPGGLPERMTQPTRQILRCVGIA